MLIPFLLFILTIIVFGGSIYLYLRKEQNKVLPPKDKYDEEWDKFYKNTQPLSASATNRKDFWKGVGIWFALFIVGRVCNYSLTLGYMAAGPFINKDNYLLAYNMFMELKLYLPSLIIVSVMVYFAATNRRQIALGMLVPFGVSIAVSILLVLLFIALCLAGGCSGLN